MGLGKSSGRAEYIFGQGAKYSRDTSHTRSNIVKINRRRDTEEVLSTVYSKREKLDASPSLAIRCCIPVTFDD